MCWSCLPGLPTYYFSVGDNTNRELEIGVFAQTRMSVPPAIFVDVSEFIKHIVALVEQAFLPVLHLLFRFAAITFKILLLNYNRIQRNSNIGNRHALRWICSVF